MTLKSSYLFSSSVHTLVKLFSNTIHQALSTALLVVHFDRLQVFYRSNTITAIIKLIEPYDHCHNYTLSSQQPQLTSRLPSTLVTITSRKYLNSVIPLILVSITPVTTCHITSLPPTRSTETGPRATSEPQASSIPEHMPNPSTKHKHSAQTES